MSYEYALAGGSVSVEQLAGRPLIARHDEQVGPPLEAELRALDHEPNVVFRTDIDETIRALVAAGTGAALLPAFAVDEDDPAITTLGLDDLRLVELLGLLWHHERVLSTAAAELRAIVCEVCGRIDREAAAERVHAPAA